MSSTEGPIGLTKTVHVIKAFENHCLEVWTQNILFSQTTRGRSEDHSSPVPEQQRLLVY